MNNLFILYKENYIVIRLSKRKPEFITCNLEINEMKLQRSCYLTVRDLITLELIQKINVYCTISLAINSFIRVKISPNKIVNIL